MSVHSIASEVSAWSPLLPVGMIFFYWRNSEITFRILGIFLLWGFAVDMKPYYLPESFDEWLYRIYVLSEMMFYGWFVFRLFPRVKMRSALIASGVGLLLWVLVIVRLSNTSMAIITESLFFSTISVIAAWFIVQYTRNPLPIERNGKAWILFGIFFYFLCTQLIFALHGTIHQDEFWVAHNGINLLTNLIYSRGLFFSLRNPSMSNV